MSLSPRTSPLLVEFLKLQPTHPPTLIAFYAANHAKHILTIHYLAKAIQYKSSSVISSHPISMFIQKQ